jgi:hypothetical protein
MIIEDLIDITNKMTYDAGVLVDVRLVIDSVIPKDIQKIHFIFQNGSYILAVDESYDTVILRKGKLSKKKGIKYISCKNKKPWSIAIGNKINWLWILTNQQGYCDGIQMEFGKESSADIVITIQMVAIASALKIKICKNS